jgi:hypothetical protein
MDIKITFVFIAILALVGCGKGGGGSAAPSKDLFSLWREDSTNAPMDLTSGAFNTTLNYSEIVTTAGEICDCDFLAIGDQTAGTYTLSNCTYRSGTGAGSDPGCSLGNGSGNYTNVGAVLSICPNSTPTNCSKYH